MALVQFRVNGGPLQSASGAATWSTVVGGLVDGGSYTVEVRARDAAGNFSPFSSVSFTIEADSSVPSVTIGAPNGELPSSATTVSVSGTASDNVSVDRVEYRVNGGQWFVALGTIGWSTTLTGLTPGTSLLFEARAIDDVGNVSTVAQRTITVNDVPVANDDAVSTNQDTAIVVDVLANDINVDAGASVTIVVTPANGTAIVLP